MKLIYKNQDKIIDIVEKNEVPYFSFPLLSESGLIKHGFSTRLGGVSTDIYSSMNLSFIRGDDNEKVEENYRRICQAIGVEKSRVIRSHQTHTTNVLVIDENIGKCSNLFYKELTDIDGMITNIPGICLSTFYADCVPLYFLDVKKKVIGLSHSGWKGTVRKIGEVTIQKMKDVYDCNPEDIYVVIGPSICQDCYEVSEDVIDEFKQAFDKCYFEQLFYPKENGKYQLDLWKANEIIMLENGILKEHIAITNVCTCCNSQTLFSHRASQGQRGNLGAFLALK